jgi:Glycosyltransferases, probably involved in cell wall biogenesis
MDILPISIIIRTYNEEQNIEECIQYCKKNNPTEILVVDGDSSDQTKQIIERIPDIKVVHSKKGLAIQRDAGIKKVSNHSKYIMIVDADDRLDEYCLTELYKTVEQSNATAVQAKHESISKIIAHKATYWEEAFLVNMKIIHYLDYKNPDNVTMIGRPALYRKDALLEVVTGASYQYTTAAEDSDLAYSLKKRGAIFVCGEGITYRRNLSTFRELYRRWLAYGSGDAKFIKTHPERRLNVFIHVLYIYPIKRAFFCAILHKTKYVPFFVLQGLIRFLGIIKFLLFGIGSVDNYK